MYDNGQGSEPGGFPPPAGETPAGASAPAYETTGTPAGGYTATGSGFPPPPTGAYTNTGQYAAPGSVSGGLSDTAAGAIAYLTIIPAILFLVIAPYNQKPFVRFHCFQSLGLGVVWFCLGIIGVIPILGWIVLLLGSLALLGIWILSIIKASQGSALNLPGISKFAAEQSGYRP